MCLFIEIIYKKLIIGCFYYGLYLDINSFLFEVDNEMENMQSLMVKLKEEKKQENGEGKSKDSSEKKSKKKKTK